jgi:hypothetical protein
VVLIRAYVQSHLATQLGAFGLTDDQVAAVTRDVQRRLASLLSRWNDSEFRRTLLVIGEEEASVYEPRSASLETRCLVVVAVRNSLLEDLGSTPEAAQHLGLLGPVLPDRSMPAITGAAIEYFAGLDLNELAPTMDAPTGPGDPFGHLPTRYPAAWRAPAEIARLTEGESRYPPVVAQPPVIDVGRPIPDGWRPDGSRSQVLSGLEPAVEPRLQKILRLVKNQVVSVFFADSFKMITRNPDKLCRVMGFALLHGRPVVTHNYFLANGCVARRDPLLRPATPRSRCARKSRTAPA